MLSITLIEEGDDAVVNLLQICVEDFCGFLFYAKRDHSLDNIFILDLALDIFDVDAVDIVV